VTVFSVPLVQAQTERQPQLEKKPPRGKAPLSGKAVAVLCVTSFIVGLLLSGNVSLMSASASSSRDSAENEKSIRASGCDNKRVSLLRTFFFSFLLVPSNIYYVLLECCHRLTELAPLLRVLVGTHHLIEL
jgi:hypothetical protein